MRKLSFAMLCFVVLFGFFSLLPSKPQALEESYDSAIIDKKPVLVWWERESIDSWIFYSVFEKGALRTYFSSPPSDNGIGLSPYNIPLRQEFQYFQFEQTLFSSEPEYTQRLDGSKSCVFIYKHQFADRNDQPHRIVILTDIGEGRNYGSHYASYSILTAKMADIFWDDN